MEGRRWAAMPGENTLYDRGPLGYEGISSGLWILLALTECDQQVTYVMIERAKERRV